MDTVEERARKDLGMIREGETYFQMVEPADGQTAPPADGAPAVEAQDDE